MLTTTMLAFVAQVMFLVSTLVNQKTRNNVLHITNQLSRNYDVFNI